MNRCDISLNSLPIRRVRQERKKREKKNTFLNTPTRRTTTYPSFEPLVKWKTREYSVMRVMIAAEVLCENIHFYLLFIGRKGRKIKVKCTCVST